MGLAAQRVQQRIAPDPQNLAWATTAPGRDMLLSLGWTPGSGLGARADGRQTNVHIAVKRNGAGLGANISDAAANEHTGLVGETDFAAVLASLQPSNCSESHGDRNVAEAASAAEDCDDHPEHDAVASSSPLQIVVRHNTLRRKRLAAMRAASAASKRHTAWASAVGKDPMPN